MRNWNKQLRHHVRLKVLRFYSTYEELKQAIAEFEKTQWGKVFTVPMRNWNKEE